MDTSFERDMHDSPDGHAVDAPTHPSPQATPAQDHPSDPVRQAQRLADWWRTELDYRLKKHMRYATDETLRVFVVQLEAYMRAVASGDVKPPQFSV